MAPFNLAGASEGSDMSAEPGGQTQMRMQRDAMDAMDAVDAMGAMGANGWSLALSDSATMQGCG